jgi:hypothetical protein
MDAMSMVSLLPRGGNWRSERLGNSADARQN